MIQNNVVIIGIGGCTRSGKGTLTSFLVEKYNIKDCIEMDIHWKSHREVDKNSGYQNWETPDAVDFERPLALLKEAIEKAKQSDKKTYILIEGFLLFAFPSIIDLINRKIFISISKKVCFHRRMSTTRVPLKYFEAILWPEHVKHYQSVKTIEDVLIIDGEQSKDKVFEEAQQWIEEGVIKDKEKKEKMIGERLVVGDEVKEEWINELEPNKSIMSSKYKPEALRIYLEGLQNESLGNRAEAIAHYKKAYRLDPELQFFSGDAIELDGKIYDQEGNEIVKPKLPEDAGVVEIEHNLYLTKEEEEMLSKHKHALDYKFTEEQKKFLDDNGYIVIKGLFAPELIDRMIAEIKDRADKLANINENNHTNWDELTNRHGFIDIWHNPAYSEFRQSPLLYSIFAQLLRCPKLTVSLDRVCMKPPHWIERDGKKIEVPYPPQFLIHNDMNLWYLHGRRYQGGLCLSDCPSGGGGFICLPGFHKLERLRKYRKDYQDGKLGENTLSPHEDVVFGWFFDKEAIEKEAKEILMEKGDFVIWDSRLPHSSATNTTDKWRYHAYIRYIPTENNEEYARHVWIATETGKRPYKYCLGGWANQQNANWEVPLHPQGGPNLTWLGERLHGKVSW